jgi:hypothetical protein
MSWPLFVCQVVRSHVCYPQDVWAQTLIDFTSNFRAVHLHVWRAYGLRCCLRRQRLARPSEEPEAEAASHGRCWSHSQTVRPTCGFRSVILPVLLQLLTHWCVKPGMPGGVCRILDLQFNGTSRSSCGSFSVQFPGL